MLEGFKSVIAFLTIIPVRGRVESIEEIAHNMHLFPIVGAGLGACVGFLGSVLVRLLPSALIAVVLTISSLYLVTGLHHFDGLLDFGDGMMVQGTPEKKKAAMRDKNTGAGGLGLGLLNTLLLLSCLWIAAPDEFMPLIMVSEASAKFAMVFGAAVAKPSSDGIGAIFIQSLKNRRGRIVLGSAALFCVAIGAFTLGKIGLLAVGSALGVSWIIVQISHRSFRCVTGDVLGSINELARSTSLLAMVAFHWL